MHKKTSAKKIEGVPYFHTRSKEELKASDNWLILFNECGAYLAVLKLRIVE